MATTTLQEWANQLRAEAGGKLEQRIRVVMTEMALDAQGEAIDLIRSRFEHGGVRTGALRRSMSGRIRENKGVLEAVVTAGGPTGGADVKYARIHEEGGVNHPKKAKWLAIPMPAAKTGSGVAKGGPRDFPNLRFQEGPDQTRAWLVQDIYRGGKGAGKGKSGPRQYEVSKSILMFKLVRRIKITGKHYLRDGMDAAVKRLPEPMQGALAAAVAVR